MEFHGKIWLNTVMKANFTSNVVDDVKLLDKHQFHDRLHILNMLKSCCKERNMLKVKLIHGVLVKEDLITKDVYIATTLITTYAKCGALDKAQEVFEQLPVRNVVAWSALITGYAQLGEAHVVLELYRGMKSEGITPDSITFIVLLTACSHTGMVEEGEKLFDEMHAVYRITPTLEHYTCMIDLFGRAGNFKKTGNLLEKVSSHQLSLFLAILGSCHKWADVNLGKWAFEQSVMLDEKCAIAYVCMGNIYAAAKMYKEAMGIEAQRLEKEAYHNSRHHESDICTHMYLFTGAKLSKEM